MTRINTIQARLSGANQASARGLVGHGAAPILALCRLLIAAGYDPTTKLQAYRGNTLCLLVRSLGAAARLTVNDDRRGAPQFRRLKASPGDVAGSLIEFETNSDHPGMGVSEEQPACPI